MTKHFPVPPRAIGAFGVRAEGPDAALVRALADLKAGFEAFKASNDESLAALAKGKADVVTTEKVDRISADVGKMQATLDDLSAKTAAAMLGGLGGSVVGDMPKTDPEYVSAFKAHMRKGDVQAALTKGIDGDGGYLAPIEWDRTITGKLKQVSQIRQNARIQSISTAGFKKLFTDRAVGSGWVGETAARPETSTPQIGVLDFVPGEIYANPAASQQILDDAAINLEQWLANEVEAEFSRQEGIAFLSGNGANKPYGILTYVTGAANAARHPWGAIEVVNSGAANGVTADGVVDLMYALSAQFAANAKLYTNRTSLAALRKLKDTSGAYLWQPSLIAGQPATFNGAPVVEVPDMPTLAAGAIAALYGDMEATYMVVDRIGIRVMRDPYTNKPYVHFYTTKRVGGGVYNPEPMRALKISA